MKNLNFDEALAQILEEDDRFEEGAYHFIRDALDYTVRMLDKPVEGPSRHVSGAELLEGVRRFALQEYGPLTRTVLKHWGVDTCEDFGAIVFNLVSKGILGKTDDDKPEDFSGGYDFDKAFVEPFQGTRNTATGETTTRSEA